jgi:hypothetical protein
MRAVDGKFLPERPSNTFFQQSQKQRSVKTPLFLHICRNKESPSPAGVFGSNPALLAELRRKMQGEPFLSHLFGMNRALLLRDKQMQMCYNKMNFCAA